MAADLHRFCALHKKLYAKTVARAEGRTMVLHSPLVQNSKYLHMSMYINVLPYH